MLYRFRVCYIMSFVLVMYYSTSYLFILIYIYIYIYDTYIISFVYIQNIRFITLYCNHHIGRVIQYILRVMYIFFMSFDGRLFSCDTYSLPVKSPRSGLDVPGTGPAWCRCGPRGWDERVFGGPGKYIGRIIMIIIPGVVYTYLYFAKIQPWIFINGKL